MTNSIPTRTIQSVASKFDDFSKWLSDNKIKIDGSRIQQYRKSLMKMADHFSSSQQAKLKLEPDHINTFLETEELITVYEAFSDSINDSLKAKISQIISGPLNYKEETNTSNKARSTGFELLIASYLRDSDLSVILSENDEDMSFQIDKYRIFLECKRPMFDHSINSNIKGAISQLHTQYRKSPNEAYSRGILAISITRALNPSQLILIANSKEALDFEMNKVMGNFVETHKQKWHADSDARTIGVLVHLSCISFMSNSNIPYTTNQFMLVHISNRNTDEDKIILKIYNSIKKKLL